MFLWFSLLQFVDVFMNLVVKKEIRDYQSNSGTSLRVKFTGRMVNNRNIGTRLIGKKNGIKGFSLLITLKMYSVKYIS